MVAWNEIEEAAPQLAAAVRGRIEGHVHHVIGTLTADGSPRLSGTEARFHNGQLWLGCMPKSIKARDMRRDPRFALHSAPLDAEMVDGDAKLSGTVTEMTDLRAMTDFMIAIGHGGDPEQGGLEPGTEMEAGVATAFICNIDAVTLTKVNVDHLEVTTWTVGGGLIVRAVS